MVVGFVIRNANQNKLRNVNFFRYGLRLMDERQLSYDVCLDSKIRIGLLLRTFDAQGKDLFAMYAM